MKSLDYVCKAINKTFEEDGTLTDTEKHFIKCKILGVKYKLEEEIKQHKQYVCTECNLKECKQTDEQIFHCIVNWN
jgi:hypothetical protein